MPRFAAASVGGRWPPLCMLCGVLGAVPTNAEPPGSPATAEDTQRSFSLLSKGFVLGDCGAVDLVGGQRAAMICQFNREPKQTDRAARLTPCVATRRLCSRGSSRRSARTTICWRAQEPTSHGVPAPVLCGSDGRSVRGGMDQRRGRREASTTLLRCISGGRSTADLGAGCALLGRVVAAPGGTVVMVAVGGCG
jgi:hypothetical protein